MTSRLTITAALLLFAVAGCTAVTPTPNPFITRPTDFNLVYEWQEGSLPPPYHYEYTITIDPAGQGQLVMVPDYAFNDPPQWTEAFTLTPALLDQFYQYLFDKGLFDQHWQAQEQPPVGGSYDSLHVTAHGQQITIPSFVIPTQASAA
ncbi:MAG TPA: hypothetical protein VMP08_05910, partial [Anaerolineae bacterium]|nr:hypothetical protein [Anaerolineae bacterium]